MIDMGATEYVAVCPESCAPLATSSIFISMWFRVMDLSPMCFMLYAFDAVVTRFCRVFIIYAYCLCQTNSVFNDRDIIRFLKFFLYSSHRFSAVKTVWERCEAGSIPVLSFKKVFPSSIERLRAWLWPSASQHLFPILSLSFSESQ